MKNEWASLEPLQRSHADALQEISDEVAWQFMPVPRPADAVEMEAWIDARTGPGDRAFLVRDQTGLIAGTTSLFGHHEVQRRAEVGWTWYGSKWRGTLLNKACKMLILTHAFEELRLRRVQLKCDARNERSFHAMASIGAEHEGTLRRHDEMWDGHIRDAELFSITDLDWPTVKAQLASRLQQD